MWYNYLIAGHLVSLTHLTECPQHFPISVTKGKYKPPKISKMSSGGSTIPLRYNCYGGRLWQIILTILSSKMDLSLTSPYPLKLRVDYWAPFFSSAWTSCGSPGPALTETFSGLSPVHSYYIIMLTDHRYSNASARSVPSQCGSLDLGLYKALCVSFHPLLHLGHPGLTCSAA